MAKNKKTKTNGKRTIQILMITVGAIMIFLSYLIFQFNKTPFLNSIQPEFASAGIVLLLVGLVWLLTKKRIST